LNVSKVARGTVHHDKQIGSEVVLKCFFLDSLESLDDLPSIEFRKSGMLPLISARRPPMSHRSCHKGGSAIGLQQSSTSPTWFVTIPDVRGFDRQTWFVGDDDEESILVGDDGRHSMAKRR
jgi:hypothetical protein